MNPADVLRVRLKSVISQTFAEERPLGKPDTMARLLAKFQRELGGVSAGRPSQDRILKAIRKYLAGGLGALDKSGLRHLCWGLANPPGNTDLQPLVDQPSRFAELARGLQGLATQGKLSFPAWRGLVVCYFAMNAESARGTAKESWLALRNLLRASLETVYAARSQRRPPPKWLVVLHENPGLFSDRPYEPYVLDWLRGDRARTDSLKTDLELPDYSWFWDWLVKAVVVSATRKTDDEFKAHILDLLRLIQDRTQGIRDEAIAAILTRFRASSDRTIHRPLLDYVIDRKVWASPRIRNSQLWGLVVPEVRKMVTGWMHERNLKDFFDLLASDPHTDKDRLDFWMRYIEQIDDSYIVMGTDAWTTSKVAFKDLRERHKDTLCSLVDGPGANNAFIMRLGNHVAVEFGMTGNACFLYRSEHLPFELGERRSFRLKALKDESQEGAFRQTHQGSWQSNLEQRLRRRGINAGADAATRARVSAVLAARAAATAGVDASTQRGYLPEDRFWAFMEAKSLRHLVEDKRDKGGWLWVRHRIEGDQVGRQLAHWGFQFKGADKGWGR